MRPATGAMLPIPLLMLALTFGSGFVDALSYLGLGHVFVANMTGNIVFLAFAAIGVGGFQPTASLIAIGSFMLGGIIAGRIAERIKDRAALLAVLVSVQVFLVAVGLALSVFASAREAKEMFLVLLLSTAMGLQNAAARTIAEPDLTTTVLTLTLSGIAQDSSLAGGSNVRLGRRVAAVACMLMGASLGAIVYRISGTAVVLSVFAVGLSVVAYVAFRVSRKVMDMDEPRKSSNERGPAVH